MTRDQKEHYAALKFMFSKVFNGYGNDSCGVEKCLVIYGNLIFFKFYINLDELK